MLSTCQETHTTSKAQPCRRSFRSRLGPVGAAHPVFIGCKPLPRPRVAVAAATPPFSGHVEPDAGVTCRLPAATAAAAADADLPELLDDASAATRPFPGPWACDSLLSPSLPFCRVTSFATVDAVAFRRGNRCAWSGLSCPSMTRVTSRPLLLPLHPHTHLDSWSNSPCPFYSTTTTTTSFYHHLVCRRCY